MQFKESKAVSKQTDAEIFKQITIRGCSRYRDRIGFYSHIDIASTIREQLNTLITMTKKHETNFYRIENEYFVLMNAAAEYFIRQEEQVYNEPELRIKLYQEIAEKRLDLYIKKNKDYGGSFTDSVKQLGLVAMIVPLHNKISRILSLEKNKESHFESLSDTYLDLFNYTVMGLIEIEKIIAGKKE